MPAVRDRRTRARTRRIGHDQGQSLDVSLLQRSAELDQLLLELDGHRLRGPCVAHELPERLLEAVALAAVRAFIEMCFCLCTFRIGEHTVHIGLHHLFAVRAGIHRRHVPTACSAIAFFRIRRPRCRRDMTVPIGISRILAASAYVKSPMSTSTTTSRKSCGTSDRAATTSFCDKRSTTCSSSVGPSPTPPRLL